MVQTATQQSEPPSKQRRRLFDEEELDLSTTRENEGHPLDIPPTPLPKIQMLVIGIVLFSDPLTSTILFPFIYFMIKDFQITDDETEIGRYAGWITSVFFICQFFTAIPWGRFSDRHGRRPVMLIGLIGNSISTCLFGLSKNLWWAVGSRALCGIVNGNSGVARSMVTEITDETNRAAAFSIFGFCWGIGLIGPAIGGFLCKPAEHFPSLFGNVQFLKDFPYFLPCLVSSIGSFGGYLLGYCCLKETNPDVIRRQKRANPDERTALLADDATARDEDDEPTTKNSSKIRQITKASYAVIVGYAMFAFQSLVFDEVLPLYFSAPIPVGGLGQDTTQVGEAYTYTGLQQIFLQFFVFPKVSRYFSTLAITRFSLVLFIVVYALFPELSVLRQWIETHIANEAARPWIFKASYILLLFFRYCGNCFGFTSYMIMVSNSAAPEILGTVNGVCLSVLAFVRSLGPAFGGTLWSLSLREGNSYPWDRHFVYYLIALISFLGYFQSFSIPISVSLGGKKRS